MAETLTEQRGEPFAGYSEEPRPLGSYAAIVALFAAGMGAVLPAAARRGTVPERVGAGDLVLLGVATHKLSRLIAKDTVTAPLRAPFTRYEGGAGMNEVAETPRGEGPRRAVGELLFCPPCVGQWVAGGFVSGFVFAPRTTRTVASLFAVQAISDFLHVAFTAARDRA